MPGMPFCSVAPYNANSTATKSLNSYQFLTWKWECGYLN